MGLLLDTDLNAEQKQYAQIVRSSGESLLQVINDILDFSKIEAGKLSLERLDFDLNATMEEFAEIMALRAEEKGLEFLCAVAPDVPVFLQGDPGRLRQLLLNLAGNAVKFTQQGEVAVFAEMVEETQLQVLLRFTVRDTGIGIPQHKQEDLFEQFTQVDVSTTRNFEGSGLGLAISKQLAELMGGEIGVDSAEQQGSQFWFTARFRKQEQPSARPQPPMAVQDKRILVVDDNATNRQILQKQLQAWGAKPEVAAHGEEALKLLRQAAAAEAPYDMAVLDMQMPGMDGATLGQTIKSEDGLQAIPLLLLTSMGQRGDAARFSNLGFAGYVTKPVCQSELRQVLGAVLANQQPQDSQDKLITRHTVREMRRDQARILVAEDNVTNQIVVRGILRKLGLSIDAVANGHEAVTALEQIPYDLVLMDVQMPEMDGLEATRQIRESQHQSLNREVPIIALTAHAMAGDREMCLEAGMNDYVAKPISADALAEAIDRWLPNQD